jgi:hypothetical protein
VTKVENRRSPLRALLIGAALTVATAYWGFYVYNIALADDWSGTALMRGPLFVLFCLVVGNLFLRALRPRLGLDQRELLIIYTMLVMGAAVSGVGMLGFLVPVIASIQYYTESFGFDRFLPYAPKHLIIHDPKVIEGFHTGGQTIWTLPIMRDWSGPVLWWSSFLLAMIIATLCLQVLVRKQWVRDERLGFPLAYVPLAITENAGGRLGGNRLFWLGFSLVACVQSLNGLNFYYPVVPHVTLRQTELAHLKQVWPWSAVGAIHISYNPFMIGVAYLLNLDLSLSIWLFYLLYKVSELVFALEGMRDPAAGGGAARYPLMDEQGVGAFIGLAVVVMWMGRRRLLEAARSAARGWDKGEEEMMSYRGALLGAGAACVYMTWFICGMGLKLSLAVPVVVLMLIFSIILSRAVAEAGFPYPFTPENAAGETVLFALGPKNVPIAGQTALGYLSAIDQFYCNNPAPHQLNAMKLGEASGMPPRHLLLAILLGTIIGLAAGWWAQLDMYYRYGAATGKIREWWPRMGYHTLRFMKAYYDRGTGPDWMTIQGMAFGMGFIILLAKLRATFPWFPLHPIGYLITGTPAARFIWVPFLLGWLVKLVVVRYGGLSLYTRLMPFFVGVIVGDSVTPAAWGVYGAISRQPTYQFF